jgi:hypothetical protein
MIQPMVSFELKRKAERRLRELLWEDGFAQPDRVDYGPSCVTLVWHSVKKAIVVDVDKGGGVGESQMAPYPGLDEQH